MAAEFLSPSRWVLGNLKKTTNETCKKKDSVGNWRKVSEWELISGLCRGVLKGNFKEIISTVAEILNPNGRTLVLVLGQVGRPQVSGTCVDSWVPLSMKPNVQPVSTAMTDSVSSPFLRQKSRTVLPRSPVTDVCRKVLTRSHIDFPVGPGAYELLSERASSSPLGSRSSSMASEVSDGLGLKADEPVRARD